MACAPELTLRILPGNGAPTGENVRKKQRSKRVHQAAVFWNLVSK